MKSGNFNFLEPSGPLQACNGTALPSLKNYLHGANPSWVANRSSAIQVIPSILWKVITAFISARHPSLSLARSIHSMPHHPLLINLPSTPRPVRISPVPHMCHMPSPSHSSWFDQRNVWWGVQIMKLLIVQSSSHHCYLIPLQPKHLPQHLILKHPQPMNVCMSVCVYIHTHISWKE